MITILDSDSLPYTRHGGGGGYIISTLAMIIMNMKMPPIAGAELVTFVPRSNPTSHCTVLQFVSPCVLMMVMVRYAYLPGNEILRYPTVTLLLCITPVPAV